MFFPLPKKDFVYPTKSRNMTIKEAQVTERTTPVAQSKCTIYGQIFETKAVRSNSLRPIHVIHIRWKK